MSEIDEFGFEKDLPVEERIDALAEQPLTSTGKPPSPEALAEAKRLAAEAIARREPGADGGGGPNNVIPSPDGAENVASEASLPGTPGASGTSPPAVSAPDADPDEEPPEPEGHRLSKEVADWLGEKEYFHGPLPFDIAAIWGHPPIKLADEATCRILIGAWGLDEFRTSTLHRAAMQDRARPARDAAAIQTRFKREREKKERKT